MVLISIKHRIWLHEVRLGELTATERHAYWRMLKGLTTYTGEHYESAA